MLILFWTIKTFISHLGTIKDRKAQGLQKSVGVEGLFTAKSIDIAGECLTNLMFSFQMCHPNSDDQT
jgi:hypothetical protein